MSIDSIVNLAAGKIGELLVQEAKLLYGVEEQVQKLQEELEMMTSYLQDMEAMDEEEGSERTRTTIKQIRKIAYDAEDVIEMYIYEATPPANKVEHCIKKYLCFCSSLARTCQVGSEIEAIKARINETMERWKKFAGENGVRIDARQGLSRRSRARIRPISYSHTVEDHVVGLDEDINKLVGVLSHGEYNKIKVVSVVGMGGSGKTTLARKLYNHELVKKQFDSAAWVSVSQQYVSQQILIDLLRNTSGETMRTDEASSLQVLVDKLHRYLERKRYLIVLDDVWEEKALKDILPALPLASDGRKIIVTTRNEEVVDNPDLKPLSYRHEPRRLNGEESWELFRKIALIQREEGNNSIDIAKLEALGKEMLEKCRGLPLAVIALAGILSQKETLEEWERVKKAVASRIMEEGKGTLLYGPVNEMLALSYIDLPSELKPCFLYLAHYQEDYEIPVGELIRIWIAEGFFTSAKVHEGDTLEDVARRSLDELVHRGLVEVGRRNCEGKLNRIRIHDLVRELCIKKAKEEDFLEIFSPKSPNTDTIVTKARRTVIFSDHDRNLLPLPRKSRHLRSLTCYVTLNLKAIHRNFSLLRVLILESVANSRSLPEGIGSLIHLRYLSLRCTNTIKLPSSFGNLRNLLTLDFRLLYDDFDIITAPAIIQKIEMYWRPPSVLENLKLHALTCLQTLKGVEGGNWMLKELPRLSPTVRKLTITAIISQEQLEAAFQCPSISSDHLHSLFLDWRHLGAAKLKSLDPIIHCQHLKKLRLSGRIDDRLSDLQLPTNINMLWLYATKFEAEATLVALGKLPHLACLRLVDQAYLGGQWTCNAGEFPQLKELTIRAISNLKEWSVERGAMPQLKRLSISCCASLRKIPEALEFLLPCNNDKQGYES